MKIEDFTPEMLERFVRANRDIRVWSHSENVYCVVDESTTDHEVNSPGDLLAECRTVEEAQKERAKFIFTEAFCGVDPYNTVTGKRTPRV